MPWLMRVLCILCFLCVFPLPSIALTITGAGQVSVRDENIAIGRFGALNCQGDGIECTDTSGILTISVSGVGSSGLEDPGGNGLVNRTALGVTEPYAGTTCTNQVLRVLSAAGAGTCITVTSAYVDSSIALTGGHLGQFAATTSAQLAGVLTNESGASGVFVLTGAKLDVFAATSSAELATVLSDEEGASGGFVRAGGNVATATALAGNGVNCSAGEAPLGVDASGAAEGCFSVLATVTGGAGIAVSAGEISTALTEVGALTDGTAAALTCGTTNGGKFGIGPGQELQYCDYAEVEDPENPEEVIPASALRSGQLTQTGLLWGVTTETCTTDSNGGKLTVIANTIVCAQDLGGSENLWQDGGAVSLTCAGAQGAHQVMDTGRLQYCGGQDTPELYDGYLLPTPFSFNITAATCTGDANGGKLTVNGSNQIVCATDTAGEGGGGSGDISGVGNITSGDAGTTAFPLTALWWGEASQPSAPASGQGRAWLDSSSHNWSVITADGVVKRLVQKLDLAEHFFVTSLSTDGVFGTARPSIASLTDGGSVVTLTASQILTNKQVVPRMCELSASSGSVTPNADTCNTVYRYDVGGQLDLQTPTATGSNPRHGQVLIVVLKAASAQQTITFSAAYDDGFGYLLPAATPATVANKVALSFYYDSVTAKWELWGVTEPPADAVVATSSTVGQIPRITGANTYAWGALNLADTDAVTGVLPNANTTAASANTASAIVARDGSGNFSAGTITAALSGNASTATALAANPSACGAGDFVTDIAADGTLTCAAPTGTGTIHLSVGGYSLPPTDPAVLDASENNLRLLFDASTSECAIWQGTLNADYVSGLTFKAAFSMTSATSGSFHLNVSVMAVTPGDSADIFNDSYAAANDCDDASVPGTAGHLDQLSCALTNADSIAAGDYFKVKICRDTGDTATGDAEVIHARLEYQR